MKNETVLFSILVSASVTAAIRFLPFMIFRDGRKIPKVITYLGMVLPAAVMAMLVVYCMKDIRFRTAESFVPELLSGTLVVASYGWKKNTLLSILIGTVCCMLLKQLVF